MLIIVAIAMSILIAMVLMLVTVLLTVLRMSIAIAVLDMTTVIVYVSDSCDCSDDEAARSISARCYSSRDHRQSCKLIRIMLAVFPM